MRKLVIAVAAAGLMALTSVAASAHISQVQLGPRVGIQSGNPTTGVNTVARYHIGVWCSLGENVSATVTLKQGTHTDTSTDGDACKGVNVHRRLNDFHFEGFHVGTGTATAVVTTSDNDQWTVSRGVRIIDCTGANACSP